MREKLQSFSGFDVAEGNRDNRDFFLRPPLDHSTAASMAVPRTCIRPFTSIWRRAWSTRRRQSVVDVRVRAYWVSASRQQEAAPSTSTIQPPPQSVNASDSDASKATFRDVRLDRFSPDLVEDPAYFPDGIEPNAEAAQAVVRRVDAKVSAVKRLNPTYETRIPLEVDGETHVFDAVWLRDCCTCPHCVDPSTKQKLFQTSDIPENIAGLAQQRKDRTYIKFTWQNDLPGYKPIHATNIWAYKLRSAIAGERPTELDAHTDSSRVLWNRDRMTAHNKSISYESYMGSNAALYDALKQLHTHGLVFLNGVPSDENSVVSIALRIGSLRDSFYGRTWNVRSVPNAKNIAYTHQFLGLHMDLLYMVDPPFLQFLHSLKADSPGGESMFADSFHAAEKLRQTSPQAFDALATFPVSYHYKNDGQHYKYTRPTIELAPPAPGAPADAPRAIARTNWSPPFQARFPPQYGLGEDAMKLRAYRQAASQFAKLVEDERNMFEYRLSAGECVIFDNRRVLHARREFDASKGERWLKGAYLDEDVFKSRLRVLGARHDEEGRARKLMERRRVQEVAIVRHHPVGDAKQASELEQKTT